jgi:hypothetical protein
VLIRIEQAVDRVAAAARSPVRPESTVAGIDERLLLGGSLDGQRRIGLDEFLVQLSERHLTRPDFGGHGCDEACGEHGRGQK